MTIRQAEERDIPAIGALLRQVCHVHHEGRPDLFRDGARKYDDAQLRRILQDEQRPVLVAQEDGAVCGYAFCVLERRGEDGAFCPHTTLYLDDLCVDERCRGQHVGTALYEAVVALARARGCYNVTLHVWNCNPSALRFYEGLGLKPRQMEMEEIL